MHKVNRTCPICKQNGKDTPLELRQINLSEAVYICEDRNCIYPIGFQWEYVKNNILEDSDNSSDETSKVTSVIKITNNTQTNTLNAMNSVCNTSSKLLHENHKNIANKQSITHDLKEKVNICKVIKKPKHVESIINKKDNVKTKEIATRSTESIHKNNLRFNNKIKARNLSGALPESVFKNAKALSKYFSNTPNETEKPKRNIKTLFDIIQEPPVEKKKQDLLISTKKSTDKKVLSEEATNLIISNTSITKDNFLEVSDNKYINSFLDETLTSPPEKLNNDLPETFDELFSNDDKCDTENQGLDLSEMDELLSFL